MSEAITAAIAILDADPVLKAAFGDRIRTGRAAQIDARPYCLLWQVVGNSTNYLGGETDMDVTTVQFDIFADRFGGNDGANALANRLRDVMAEFRRGKVANVFLASILRISGPRQTTERFGDGADEAIAKVSIDYRFHHNINRTG